MPRLISLSRIISGTRHGTDSQNAVPRWRGSWRGSASHGTAYASTASIFTATLFTISLTSLALVALGCGGCSDSYGTNAGDGGTGDASHLGDGWVLSDASVPRCGDGVRDPGEACDDGNTESGDGCSADCGEVEPDWACPKPGDPCVLIVVCGNGRIEGSETCDDRNTVSGDGCSDTCQVEPGWICPVVGAACVSAGCGDGYLAGFEACDDGNLEVGDGCDDHCRLEEGWDCPIPNSPCHPTVCGDGVVEGTEECDDGNLEVGDGCTPFCKREPSCSDGVCDAICGDGVVWPPEECDDGNTMSGDGCSATCSIEVGFTCEEVPLPDPSEVRLPITLRDFVAACGSGARLQQGAIGASAPYGHPDFECYNNGFRPGMVETMLGPNGKPQWVASDSTQSQASFDLWYVSNPDFNRAYAQELVLPLTGDGTYEFDNANFFPLTGLGFVAEDCGGSPCELTHTSGGDGQQHNFHFTSEVRYWFEFNGTELLTFRGDDDVWVFINRRLAVDIGGVHGATERSVDLSDTAMQSLLNIQVGGIYEAVVFQAERHTTQSNYRLTLANFNRAPSVCISECGDGIVSSVEACDDGVNDGSYGGCTPDCLFGPYCGDGIVQTEHGEVCDDGLNLGGDASACSPGCQSFGAFCGDGVVQPENGEQCDDGNNVSGDGCTADCQIEVL